MDLVWIDLIELTNMSEVIHTTSVLALRVLP